MGVVERGCDSDAEVGCRELFDFEMTKLESGVRQEEIERFCAKGTDETKGEERADRVGDFDVNFVEASVRGSCFGNEVQPLQ
jgi:hypothetical protein